jgi:serine/threonine protein kinase
LFSFNKKGTWLIAKESPHLVSYSETFEWGDYFCIKMEYCKMGDLQNYLKKKNMFSEEVQFHFFFFCKSSG